MSSQHAHKAEFLDDEKSHGEYSYESLSKLDRNSIRSIIRANQYQSHTAGLAPGYLQANLVIMPESYALDFMRFCQRNPKPCPLVAVSDTGIPMMFTAGKNIDVSTDVPHYNIYRDCKLQQSQADINDIWQDDFVAFALGCSFTFEHAAMRAGIKFWHIEHNKTVPMYRTNIPCVQAGPFAGNMVVSMRTVRKNQIDLIVEISSQYPLAHGAPIHIGNPEDIGIENVSTPDWGDAVPIKQGDITVFWACGVTPQAAIENAQIPIVITHVPGRMLITDIDECANNPILNPTLSTI